MKYDFDTIVDREGTNCEKYDSRKKIFGRHDVIPLWVADMDFEVGPFITEAILKRASHPVYGYTFRSGDYHNSIKNWIKRRNGWDIESDWLDFTPGVVAGFAFAIRAFTAPGDGVVINPPVYPPFAAMIKANDREVLCNPLKMDAEGYYSFDFDDLERKLAGVKALLFCNPHNPTGRAFTGDELRRVGELCVNHDVIIISDEIHSDLVFKPNKHIHIASLSPRIADRCVTLIAPSKTFNIAGLSTSVAIISNPTLRRRFRAELDTLHACQGNVFGTVALEAAYDNGDQWVDQMLEYVSANVDYLVGFVETNIPRIKVHPNEATYLVWADCHGLGMEHDDLCRFMIEEAGLGLNDGIYFGEEGRCFMRINVGTSRAVLKKAMGKLLSACKAKGLV